MGISSSGGKSPVRAFYGVAKGKQKTPLEIEWGFFVRRSRRLATRRSHRNGSHGVHFARQVRVVTFNFRNRRSAKIGDV